MGKFSRNVFRGARKNIVTLIGAVLIIAVGVFICVSSLETVLNLRNSVDYFYEQGELADVFVNVKAMPVSDLQKLNGIRGVEKSDGRLTAEVRLLEEDADTIVSVHLMGYQESGLLNRVIFYAFDRFRSDSIYIGRKMERSRNLQTGQKLSLIIDDRVYDFVYSGSIAAPNYIYTIPPSGAVNSDGSDYDLALIDHQKLEEYLDKKGMVNEIGIRLAEGFVYSEVEDELRVFFENYGLLGMTQRKDQISYKMVESELEELIYAGTFVPVLFMLMSVFMLYIVLKRGIDRERVLIGTMKALGMKNSELIVPYLFQAIIIGFLGTCLGLFFGEALGKYYLQMYGDFFSLPDTSYHAFLPFRLGMFAVNIAVCLLAVFIGVGEIIHIKPADAMRGEVPSVERFGKFPVRLRWNPFIMMGLRSLMRSRLRTVLISAAIGFPFGMGLCLFSFKPNFNRVFDVYEYSQAYDIGLALSKPGTKSDVEASAKGLKFIQSSEAIAQLPIVLKKENRETTSLLFGLNPFSENYRIYHIHKDVKEIVQPSERGLIINSRLANKLDLKAGDEVEIRLPEISPRWVRLPILRVIKEATGGGAYLSLFAFDEKLQIPMMANRLLINAKPGYLQDVKKQIMNTKRVLSITDTKWILEEYKRLFSTANLMIDMFIYMTVFAGVVLIYNIMLISARERANEYATLKLLGISMEELGKVLLTETAVYLFFGLGIGMPVAGLIRYILEGMFAPDEFTLEIWFTPHAYLKSGGMCLLIVVFTVISVMRFIGKINPVDSLKERS